MPYNNIISRTDASPLVPEDVSNELLDRAREQSAALSLFRNKRLSRNQQRLPVKSALPTAYFVNGDTGLKQTTESNWDNKYLDVEEIAAIVPIPEAVVDDVEFGIWEDVQDDVAEAIAYAFDAAVFFGVNKPASWPDDIVTAASAVGVANTYTRGTNAAAAGGIAEDLNQLMGLVEADGFDPNGFAFERTSKVRLRGARDADGNRISDISQDAGTIMGLPSRFLMPGNWPTPGSQTAEGLTGDFRQGIVGVRQDLTFKLLTEAVIQDGAGDIVYNLAQQDMVAMRIVFRVAWQVANTINRQEETESARYPFAVLLSPV